MTDPTRVNVLPSEPLRTYACADCGRLVFVDDVPEAVLREYLRTGERPTRCQQCEQEDSKCKSN